VKKVDSAKVSATSISSLKPVYVAARPTNLVREPVKAGGREYSTKDLELLQVTQRGFVRTTDGKGLRFISWGRKS
jgi:hypothetical protein